MRAIRGKAWIFGDDVNTDVIHPPQFYSLNDETVKRGLFNGFDASLQPRLSPGDIFVAGRNFGCGSSRETSIRSLKLNEVGAIVAGDFARIFFRSATNNGIPCLTPVDAALLKRIRSGETVEICFRSRLLSTNRGVTIPLEPVSPFVMTIWQKGGLLGLLPP